MKDRIPKLEGNFVVQLLSYVQLSEITWTVAHQASYPSLSPIVYSYSSPLSQWCHPTISSSVAPFSCPLSFPESGYFPWVGSSHQVAKVLELQLQHQSSQWIFRVDFRLYWLVRSPFCPRHSKESSSAPQFVSINSLAFSLLYGPALPSILDYWKIHSFDYIDLIWQSDVSVF